MIERPNVLGLAALASTLLLASCLGRMDLDGTVEERTQPEEGAISSRRAVADAPVPSAPVLDGRALVAKHECNRCHEGTGLEPAPANKRCFHCHEEIATGRFAAPPAAIARWKPRVDRLRHAPSLSRVGALISPRWVAGYLTAPHDLRPALHAEMPRLDLDAREAEAIASWLGELGNHGGPKVAGVALGGDADAGRRAFQTKGCATCHAFTGSGVSRPAARPDAETKHQLAPDLAFARQRLRREKVVAWIREPQSVVADATMPKQAVTLGEAIDLTAFIFDAPLDAPRAAPIPERLPLLERKVGYDEVAGRVLHAICWHCHAQPDFARGDGGPGNTGGFGFAGRELDLSSYEAIVAGYRGRDGQRASVFAPVASGPAAGEPMLVAVLLARHDEERGAPGAVRGMPLGLPPLSAEDIQLVASWVAQGHPR